MKIIHLLLISLLLLSSCVLVDDSYKVTGRILLNGTPEKDISISLSGTAYPKQSCKTDSSGYFEMNVDKNDAGTYLLTVLKRTQRSASYLIKTDSIHIFQDVNLEDINLIKTIDLQVSCEQSTGTGHLTWTRSTNELFSEYKVYRSNGEVGLNDKNGILIYRSNSLNDTIYYDHGIALETNTYRIDVYNNSMKIGQSNLNSLFFQP